MNFVFHFIYWPAAEKRGLRTNANSVDPDQPALQCSLVRIFSVCLHNIGTVLKKKALIARVLTRRVAVQTGPGFLSVFRMFVRFVLVWYCWFPLPLGVWEGLRFVIVALPGLFSYHILFFQIIQIN